MDPLFQTFLLLWFVLLFALKIRLYDNRLPFAIEKLQSFIGRIDIYVFFKQIILLQYWRCVNGEGMQFKCQPGTVFNTKLNVCDWPDNADRHDCQL